LKLDKTESKLGSFYI